jgi:pantoate--beta-alanine ligase
MGDIEVFKSVQSLQSRLHTDQDNVTIGLIPTMGALHQGHMSLVQESLRECDLTVVSIFVNPTQFNNPSDLEKYPRNFEKDVNILQEQGDIIVFAPPVSEVYPTDHQMVTLELGQMGLVMEGKFREGHFDGVINVVKRLFDIVKPNHSYFGLKDFQQLSVVQFMVKSFDMSVNVVGCEIYREPSGLASSSRNERLSEQDKEDALIISQSLKAAKKIAGTSSPQDVVSMVHSMFEESKLELEYFQIVDPVTLLDVNVWQSGAHACMTAYCGEVRLLDNLQLVPLT